MTNTPNFPRCKECISYCICIHQKLLRCNIISKFSKDSHGIYSHSEFWKKLNKALPNAGVILKERQ